MIIYALKCGFHVKLHSFSAKLNFPFNTFYKYTMLQECSTKQFKMYMYRKRGWGEGVRGGRGGGLGCLEFSNMQQLCIYFTSTK